jgi:cytoskeleton protein RodZ
MERVGEKLRRRREELGFTIDDIARATKYRPDVIQAIEEGRSGVFPAEAYRQAFLRAYADKLGLDPADIVREQKSEEERVQEALKGIRLKPRTGPGLRRTLVWLAVIVGVAAGILLVYDRVIKVRNLPKPPGEVEAPRPAMAGSTHTVMPDSQAVVPGDSAGVDSGAEEGGESGEEEPQDIGEPPGSEPGEEGSTKARTDGETAAGLGYVARVEEPKSGSTDAAGEPEERLDEPEPEDAVVGGGRHDELVPAGFEESGDQTAEPVETEPRGSDKHTGTSESVEPRYGEVRSEEPVGDRMAETGRDVLTESEPLAGRDWLAVSVRGYAVRARLRAGDSVLVDRWLRPGFSDTFYSNQPFWADTIVTYENSMLLVLNGERIDLPVEAGNVITDFRISP